MTQEEIKDRLDRLKTTMIENDPHVGMTIAMDLLGEFRLNQQRIVVALEELASTVRDPGRDYGPPYINTRA